jgi:hypothetical protein
LKICDEVCTTTGEQAVRACLRLDKEKPRLHIGVLTMDPEGCMSIGVRLKDMSDLVLEMSPAAGIGWWEPNSIWCNILTYHQEPVCLHIV